MADGVDDLFVWGEDFEAILGILEDDEEVEELFSVAVRIVSWKSCNFELWFRTSQLNFATDGLLDVCKQTKLNERSRKNYAYILPFLQRQSSLGLLRNKADL